MAEKNKWLAPFVGRLPKGVSSGTNYFEQLYSLYSSEAEEKKRQLSTSLALTGDVGRRAVVEHSAKMKQQLTIQELEKETEHLKQCIRNPVITFKGTMDPEEIYKYIMSKRTHGNLLMFYTAYWF